MNEGGLVTCDDFAEDAAVASLAPMEATRSQEHILFVSVLSHREPDCDIVVVTDL